MISIYKLLSTLIVMRLEVKNKNHKLPPLSYFWLNMSIYSVIFRLTTAFYEKSTYINRTLIAALLFIGSLTQLWAYLWAYSLHKRGLQAIFGLWTIVVKPINCPEGANSRPIQKKKRRRERKERREEEEREVIERKERRLYRSEREERQRSAYIDGNEQKWKA